MIVVDNGGSDADVVAGEGRERVQLLEPRENLGFAGGCNFGAAEATSDVLVFLNPDTVVGPGALRQLARTLEDPEVGIAMARLCLLDRPELLNSGGSVVHVSGLAWAGRFGEQAESIALARGCGRRERRCAGDPARHVSRPRRLHRRALHVPGGRRAELARPPRRAARRRRSGRRRLPRVRVRAAPGEDRAARAQPADLRAHLVLAAAAVPARAAARARRAGDAAARRPGGAGSAASSAAGGGACATCAGSFATGARRSA